MSNDHAFTKGVERLINPIEVGTIHFIHGINKMLPMKLQNKLSETSIKDYPVLGFIVEPYSSFLCYEIKDVELAKSLLPDGFSLLKTKIFDTDNEAKYYAIFGVVRAHTSAFWGSRLEFYVIALDDNTGLLTWVIIDYDTNTIGQDPKYGLREPNSKQAVITINHRGVILVDIKNDLSDRHLSYACDVNNGVMKPLDQRLWLEGNLSVTYGKELSLNNARPFGLRFEPCEVEKALEIPFEDISIEQNTWFPHLFADKPEHIVVFPYAQHFLADTPGKSITIKNQKELEESVKDVDFTKIKPISVSKIKYLFVGSVLATIVLTLLHTIIILFR